MLLRYGLRPPPSSGRGVASATRSAAPAARGARSRPSLPIRSRSANYYPGLRTRRGRWPVLFGRPLPLLCALLIAFLCCRLPSLLSAPEFALLDQWFVLRAPRAPDPHLALVAVDRAQLAAFKQHKDDLIRRGKRVPCTCASVGRDTLGETVEALRAAGAVVIGLDFQFELPCPEHDPRLCAALSGAQAGPIDVVLLTAAAPTPGRFNFSELPPFLALKTPPIVASPVLYNPNGRIRGVQLLQEDPPTGVPPRGGLSPRAVRPALAVACWLLFRGQPHELPEATGSSYWMQCAGERIPVLPSEHVLLLRRPQPEEAHHDQHAMLINWAGHVGTFPMYSLRATLQATPAQRRQWFSNRIVLIGSSADRQLAPHGLPARPAARPLLDQSDEQAMAGLEVQANALDTLLQRRYLRTAPPALMWALIAGCSWLTIMLFRHLGGWRALLASLLQVAVLMLVAYLLLRRDYWLYAFTPSLAIFVSAIIGAVWAFSEARQTATELAGHIEARDAATSALVHDLKQPLAAISALAQVLRAQEQAGTPPGPELIEHIQKQVNNALGDIDELLTLDPGRTLALSRTEFDLAALARDLAVAQGLRSSLHQVEVQAPPEGVRVRADARYLARALSNLVDNAIKYWPAGGTIVVQVLAEPQRAVVRVIDGGLGISPEALRRLFTRFQRAVPAGVDIPGTGIGLFSVKRIVEAHGGTVHVHSAPGEGSTFEMTLPLSPQVAPEATAVSHQEHVG